MMKTTTTFRLTPLAAALLASFSAQAQLPTNPVLVNGSATINETATGLRVSNLPGTILNWDSFNIGTNRSVEFAQISAGSAVLNRVTGNTRSEILGALTSNGRVFLLNPNGVLFGNGARVDVQGLVASTLDLSNEDFLAGNYRFVCTNDVACDFSASDALNPTRNSIVLKDGSQITTRTAGNGGQVWLIARGVVKTEAGSRIDAPLGQVAMAAGREVIVTSPSLGAITFTLDRIAGSQIDLAGDIDVERGAAGFFADSIRFAGNVRVPSATDGAGQIVASAGTRIDVDDDARLNVSGAANADGGAVRLQATQTIRVSAAAEIAADGGNFTAAAPGGMGGFIGLEAAEVKLPIAQRYIGLGEELIILSGLETSTGQAIRNGLQTATQLHARGQSATGFDLARYGRISVDETGTFTYENVGGPSLTGSNSSLFTTRQTRTPGQFNQTSSTTILNRESPNFSTAAIGSDGSVLLVSATSVAAVNQTSDNSGTSGSSTASVFHDLHVVDASGAFSTTVRLSTDDTTPGRPSVIHNYQVIGLTKGGWVVRDFVTRDFVLQDEGRLLFIDSAGRELSRIEINSTTPVRALLNGGVLLSATVNGAVVDTVRDARGVIVADSVAALRGENRMGVLGEPSSLFSGVNFDERRGFRVSADKTQLEQFDRSTNVVESTRALSPAGDVLFTVNQAAVLFGVPDATTGANEIGVVDDGTYQPLSQNSSRSTRNADGTAITLDSIFGLPLALDSSHLGLMTVRSEFSFQSATVESEFSTSTRSASSGSQQSTFNQINRQLSNTPFASQTTAASYVVLAGAASTPGRSNGSFAPPLVTPPSPPPVTPPSPPPVSPSSPGPVTPPAAPAPVTPPAVTPPPSGGVTLEIRPPQTIVPPPGNTSPKPPNTARPKGPSTGDVRGSEDDVLQSAADREEDLVRDLVCSELSAADCLKFDTGLSDIKKDLVDKVTRKQLSGPYWEVIDEMAPDTSQKFFEAIGDLQTNGELDEELRGGLDDALFERPIGPDGKPGDSALDRTLGVYDLLVKQAKTPEEKEQLRRDMAEDLLDAAKQQVASKKPAPSPAPPPPGADVSNESILVDEAQIKADVKAQNEARAAEAAAEAAAPKPPAP